MSTPTTTVTAVDPYAVPLSIYRNRQWIQSFTVSEDGSPIDISQDSLALVVLSGVEVILSNVTPTVSSGANSCTFVFVDGQTETLTANERYVWQFLRKAAGFANSDLLCAGPLNVADSPPFP
jgi:hypothetical protein